MDTVTASFVLVRALTFGILPLFFPFPIFFFPFLMLFYTRSLRQHVCFAIHLYVQVEAAKSMNTFFIS
jgi:hypothetical protein